MPRKLPVLVERTIADTRVLRSEIDLTFTQKVQAGLHEAGVALSCKKGCSNCCSHPFLISVIEGFLLYQALAKRGLWTPSFRKRLEETREKTIGLTFEVWMLSNISCPLLTEKRECLVHDARPLNCRLTFAITDPSLCHPHRISEGTRFIPRHDPLDAFQAQERALLRRMGAREIYAPLSEAVLLGARISLGEIAFEDAIREYAKDRGKALP